MHTVTGIRGGRAAHAARPPAPVGVWLAVTGGLALAAGAVAAAAALWSDGPATSTPGSAQTITTTRPADPRH